MVIDGAIPNIDGFEVSALLVAGGGHAAAFSARHIATGRLFEIHLSRRDVEAPGGHESYLIAEVVQGRCGRARRSRSIAGCLSMATVAIGKATPLDLVPDSRNVA